MAEPGIWGRRELGIPYLDYELIVIGSGPAGQRAARDCRRVALIELRQVFSGYCLHTGTIPSKTLREGVLYETLNIAAKWELPLCVVLENNLYAQSTPQHLTLAGDIPARAAAFGIKTALG